MSDDPDTLRRYAARERALADKAMLENVKSRHLHAANHWDRLAAIADRGVNFRGRVEANGGQIPSPEKLVIGALATDVLEAKLIKRRWSQEECRTLLRMASEGVSSDKIARILDRTPLAVRVQLTKLNSGQASRASSPAPSITRSTSTD